jgi:hypothetical protein
MGKFGEEICLYLRDERTGRLLFNARAMLVLGLEPEQMRERGYPLKEVPEERLGSESDQAA